MKWSTKSGANPWPWGYTSSHENQNCIIPMEKYNLICIFLHTLPRSLQIALHLLYCGLPEAASEQAVIRIGFFSTIGLRSGPAILHSGRIMPNTWKAWIWCVGGRGRRIWEEHMNCHQLRIAMRRLSPHSFTWRMGLSEKIKGLAYESKDLLGGLGCCGYHSI